MLLLHRRQTVVQCVLVFRLDCGYGVHAATSRKRSRSANAEPEERDVEDAELSDEDEPDEEPASSIGKLIPTTVCACIVVAL